MDGTFTWTPSNTNSGTPQFGTISYHQYPHIPLTVRGENLYSEIIGLSYTVKYEKHIT